MSTRSTTSSGSNGKGAEEAARDAAADIGAQLAQMQEQLAALTRSLGETGQSHAEAMAATVQDGSRKAARAAGAHGEEFGRIARDAMAEVERSAHRNPALTVGLAAGLGFLAALVLARR